MYILKNDTMKNAIYFTSILFLTLSLSSCCKCKPSTQRIDLIYLENFSESEISNPNVIISYSTSKDTIALTLDTLNNMSNRLTLVAPNTLNVHGDWLVKINDSLHYTVNNFLTQTGTKNCCKGVTSLTSYEVNGALLNSSVILIEK